MVESGSDRFCRRSGAGAVGHAAGSLERPRSCRRSILSADEAIR
jgi:hypothetical protein